MRPRIATVFTLALALGVTRGVQSQTSETSVAASPPAPSLVIVVGAPGAPTYATRFAETAARWQKAAARAKAPLTIIGLDNDSARPALSDRARLEAVFKGPPGAGPLWLVLIGHGTHDGRQARFNLRGPDVSAQELATWCKPLTRPLVVVNGASASAPFLAALSGPQRVVVTATKTAGENSAPRFGSFFAEAIADGRADLDRDGGVSLLEAFVHASRRVEASFSEEGLLASEHALLDDNGDGLGTGAAFFRGLVASAPAPDESPRDGARARQMALIPAPAEAALPPAVRRRRDQLEQSLMTLRDQRARLGDAAFHARAGSLLLELARLYRQAGLLTAPDAAPSAPDARKP
jgi:hypothetical protein